LVCKRLKIFKQKIERKAVNALIHGFFVFGEKMKLEDWRKEIDSIDAEIVRLINERVKIAQKIGVLKATAGLPIVDAGREDAILQKVAARNQGVLTNEAIVRIFRGIIRESRQIQVESQNIFCQNSAQM
jgi:monofunctional chorismate mutase